MRHERHHIKKYLTIFPGIGAPDIFFSVNLAMIGLSPPRLMTQKNFLIHRSRKLPSLVRERETACWFTTRPLIWRQSSLFVGCHLFRISTPATLGAVGCQSLRLSERETGTAFSIGKLCCILY